MVTLAGFTSLETGQALGAHGWIVVGLRILGGCGRQCDPTMFLESLCPLHESPSLDTGKID